MGGLLMAAATLLYTIETGEPVHIIEQKLKKQKAKYSSLTLAN